MSFLTPGHRLLKPPARTALMLAMALLTCPALMAEEPKAVSSVSNPIVVVMIILMGFLAIIIAILAHVVLGAAQYKLENEKKEADGGIPAKALIVLFLMVLSAPLMAEDKGGSQAAISGSIINGVSNAAFYLMASVILLESIVVLALLYNLRAMLDMKRKKKKGVVAHTIETQPKVSWWERLNRFRPAEQEVSIDTGHNYDGIRELNNRLPPWWLYGFYASILFACIYLWRYHVAHTAPLSGEEYQIAVAKADQERQAYLKKTANNIDETNALLLTSPEDLAAGKAVFQSTCFACHGKQGEGLVGPNLTDEYWLHGGALRDVFKTIKYGYPEKGMKSWKDDYSPKQIEQIASYVKSLKGTHPANAKAPQGTIYNEEEPTMPNPAAAPGKTAVAGQ